ncbi:MAG: replication-relaxation family protein [Microthrixaceae bacterium]
MTSNKYVTTRAVTELRQRLSDDDWAIVSDVERMRLASALDLQALASLRGEVQVRQFRRRLQRLFELDILARLDRRVGGARSGSTGWVYALGLAGQRLVDPGDGTSVRRPWTPRPSWLNHALASSHLYVVLRQADQAGDIRLLDYQSEPLCWRPIDAAEGQATLKPDAFVRFEVGDFVASVFVEVDMATESPATLHTKCETYRGHWLTDAEQTDHGVYPEVLWLVPTAGRRRVLEKVIDRQPEETRALHRVRLYDDARAAFIEPP